jgi:hypothetical protein
MDSIEAKLASGIVGIIILSPAIVPSPSASQPPPGTRTAWQPALRAIGRTLLALSRINTGQPVAPSTSTGGAALQLFLFWVSVQ